MKNLKSGNPILDKNLECIAKYNPELKEKLLNLPYLTNKIDLIETKLNEPNLLYNGTPLHSQEGAEIEAKTKFAKIINNKMSMHIVFGIGIGHLFKECCEKSNGKVFLYEPNLEILRVTLELVDFSKELSQPNVFVSSEMEVFKELYSRNYLYKANSGVLILDSYSDVLYANEIKELLDQFSVIFGMCILPYRTLMNKGITPIETVLKNVPYMLNATPLYELKDIYKGKTALVVSAGPTLDTSIETIKKNRDKVIIFCVGTAFKTLANNGITPDFVNIIENMDCSGQLMGHDLSEINLITGPYTHNAVYLLNVKQNFLYPSDKCDVNNYWSELTGVDISHYYTRGTVSYAALASAKMLGFSKLVLVGQDLAFLNNKCYSSNGTYSDLTFRINPETQKPEFGIKDKESFIKSFDSIKPNTTREETEEYAKKIYDDIVKTLYFVKGINGEMLPTQAGYGSFINYLSKFAYENRNLDLINTSMIGAQIDGFKNIPLEEALKNVPTVKKIELTKSYKYDKGKIVKKLAHDIEFLENILDDFAQAKEYIFEYEIDAKLNKTFTREAGDYIKLLLSLYEKVKANNSNYLYKSLSLKEDIEVATELNLAEDFNLTVLEKLFVLLKNYYFNIEGNILTIIEKIKDTKEIINESINSESKKCICKN